MAIIPNNREKMELKVKKFSKELIRWYSENKRIFPWRYVNDPFKVMISEIMLQRTRAENVIDSYKFLTNDIKSVSELSNTDIQYLNNIFQNLGLLYRATKLKNICKYICESNDCNIPDSQEELLKIPGIGLYTSNAILCFGYGKKYPIVDTNVLRIFERIFGIKSSTKSPHKDKKIWIFAEKLLPSENYIDYNYALLDFAAKVCKSRNPTCNECPFRKSCKYFENSAFIYK